MDLKSSMRILIKLKKIKINILVHKYKLFKIEPYKTITKIFTRFIDILNGLKSLRRVYTNSYIVRKILRSLSKNWELKVTAISEVKDLNNFVLEELIGSLMTHELNMNQGKEEVKKKKSIALKAAAMYEEDSDSEVDSKDDEEMALITRMFKKFMRRKKKFQPRKRSYSKGEGSKEKKKKRRIKLFAMSVRSPNIF